MKIINWLKFLRLPSPKELGWSASNALASRRFPTNTKEKTWEDWDEKMRKEYPIRFFLNDVLVSWFRAKWRQWIKNPIYWIKCHILPSYRYHILDLRQSKKKVSTAYRYGWIDSDTKMVLALVKILNDFVEHEMPNWYCPSEEDIQDNTSLIYQRNKWLEVKAIHYWWNVEKPRLQKEYDKLIHTYNEAEVSKAQHFLDEIKKFENLMDNKEEEMLIRLIKIRRSLWT